MTQYEELEYEPACVEDLDEIEKMISEELDPRDTTE